MVRPPLSLPVHLALLAIIASRMRISSAQLVGTLSSNPAQPQLIDLVVTNPTDVNISVLAWNNIFDTARPFNLMIVDGSGATIPTRTTHVTNAGMDFDDLLDLKPGQNFTRQVSLDHYLMPEVGQPASNASAVIMVQTAFQGLVDHDGVYNIDPAAAVQRDGNGALVALGNLSKANLTSITLQMEALRTSIAIPDGPRASNVRREELWNRGMIVQGEDCSSEDRDWLEQGIKDAGLLALSGIKAIDAAPKTEVVNAQPHPYPWWFGRFAYDHHFGIRIKELLTRLNGMATRTSSHQMFVRCATPTDEICVLDKTEGYAFNDPSSFNTKVVVVCRLGLDLPWNMWPCTGPSGSNGDSIGSLVAHEAMHDQSLTGFTAFPRSQGEIYGEAPAHQYAIEPIGRPDVPDSRPDLNPDNYAFFLSHSWDVGYGPLPWSGPVCLNYFSAPGK
ncbi:MAG: hypothetical protein M1832_000937 [Thelocarpon impressellum]|nr:MAG: hypothetical protein M1832_000937 [Thelocarpon impressellum]